MITVILFKNLSNRRWFYKRPWPPGFTLIEVLLAVALTAIILAALYGSFLVSHRAIQASEGTLMALHEARTALEVIRQEVEAAFAYTDRGVESLTVSDRDFYGAQASGMSFSTHSSVLHGPATITYRIEEREERLVLVKAISRIGGDHLKAPEAEMVEEIASFLIEVSNNGSTWHKTWMENQLPYIIRITLEIPLNERTIKLTTTAKPRQGQKI